MNYYGNFNQNATDLEVKNCKMAREAAREGIVLLKNEGALPLKSKKIALYGMGARRTVKGGTGSGSVNERHSASIEEGLENAGYIITTKQYLDDYDLECDTAHAVWRQGVEELIAPLEPMQGLMKALEVSFQIPEGRLVTEDDIINSGTDTAIYVIARQAGEGNDRKEEPGDYQITENEYANLELLGKRYGQVILVINIGGYMDLSFMDTINGINALVFYAQGGMEGGNALADLLSGNYNFSGKLSSTWTKKYSDYPESQEFSYINGNLEEENYKEGIYIGYRYFDSFNVEPLYPFGFGLSYTEFAIQATKVVMEKDTVKVWAEVENKGKDYAGKEVVQAYLSCPDGKLKKPYQDLAAFVKTESIAPGAKEEVLLIFSLADMASYEEESAHFVLEAGDYLLRIGNSSRNTKVKAVLHMPESKVVEQCKNCCSLIDTFEEMKNTRKKKTEIPSDAIYLEINTEDISVKVNEYKEPSFKETIEIKELLDCLTKEEMAELLRGGDLHMIGNHQILGAAGKTAITLMHKGIGNIIMSDGPAGLNIINHVTYTEEGVQKTVAVPERYSFGKFAKNLEKTLGSPDDLQIYRYATAWPAGILLAQSWNPTLVGKIGFAVGEEMIAFGITLWLAPGMNIHRNPLCGRTFEYYSEDPVLSGNIAAAMVKGVQKQKGAGTTVKHFCCNNQEDNRAGVSSNVSERALREIYLKGFRIAITQGKPLALMSSYNKLNGIYTANHYELLVDILRSEWGYEGLVMTDWNGKSNPKLCAASGNDLIMPGQETDKEAILEAIEDGTLSENALRCAAGRILQVILQSNIYNKNQHND